MADAPVDSWSPQQYDRFRAERSQPFFDLLALVSPVAGGDVIDLGCGSGELTANLHKHAEARSTVGIDSSAAMLEGAPTATGLRFELRDIADVGDVSNVGERATYDVVFANAALQWLPDHEQFLARLTTTLRPGGQLAVQVPANSDHPSHTVAAAVAHESPFLEAMGGAPPPDAVNGVLRPERYAEILDALGFTEQHVRLQVYAHHLDSTSAVVEWTKGTTLTRFRRVLSPEMFEQYVDRYRQRLVAELGEHAPYFYAFKRILFWGRVPA